MCDTSLSLSRPRSQRHGAGSGRTARPSLRTTARRCTSQGIHYTRSPRRSCARRAKAAAARAVVGHAGPPSSMARARRRTLTTSSGVPARTTMHVAQPRAGDGGQHDAADAVALGRERGACCAPRSDGWPTSRGSRAFSASSSSCSARTMSSGSLRQRTSSSAAVARPRPSRRQRRRIASTSSTRAAEHQPLVGLQATPPPRVMDPSQASDGHARLLDARPPSSAPRCPPPRVAGIVAERHHLAARDGWWAARFRACAPRRTSTTSAGGSSSVFRNALAAGRAQQVHPVQDVDLLARPGWAP